MIAEDSVIFYFASVDLNFDLLFTNGWSPSDYVNCFDYDIHIVILYI